MGVKAREVVRLAKAIHRCKMRSLVDRWSISTGFFFVVLKALQGIQFFFPSREDGWRKAARAYYRGEESKFVLGLFYLKSLPDIVGAQDLLEWTTEAAQQLRSFFSVQRAARVQLRWRGTGVSLFLKKACDCMVATYAGDGAMSSLHPVLDPKYPSPCWFVGEGKTRLLGALLNSFNATREEKDAKRPSRLWQTLDRLLRSDCVLKKQGREARAFIERLLGAIWVSGSQLAYDAPIETRFEHPDFLIRKHPGFAVFHVHVRRVAGLNEMDLFAQCSHIAIDGRPAATMLQALRAYWGESRAPLYPPNGFCTKLMRSTSCERNALYQMQLYIDTSSALETRKRLLSCYGSALSELPLLSLVGWALAKEGTIRGHKILFPVELDKEEGTGGTEGYEGTEGTEGYEGAEGYDACLSFILMRPCDYEEDVPDGGFLRFQREFNHSAALTKGRQSATYTFMKTVAIVHPKLYAFPLLFLPKGFANFVGSFGVTMLKETEYVVVPTCGMFKGGSIAIGNLNLPSVEGRTVGIVSIKGTQEQVLALKSRVQKAFVEIERYFG